jgi:hypothetical protein
VDDEPLVVDPLELPVEEVLEEPVPKRACRYCWEIFPMAWMFMPGKHAINKPI